MFLLFEFSGFCIFQTKQKNGNQLCSPCFSNKKQFSKTVNKQGLKDFFRNIPTCNAWIRDKLENFVFSERDSGRVMVMYSNAPSMRNRW